MTGIDLLGGLVAALFVLAIGGAIADWYDRREATRGTRPWRLP